MEVEIFERRLVVHFADPGMKCCLYVELWIQYIDGSPQASSLVERQKEDNTDLLFSTVSSLESVVAVQVLLLLLFSTSISDDKHWM